MKKEVFLQRIVEFIQEFTTPPQHKLNITVHTQLIETKIVDSLLLTELILFIEDLTNSMIDIESFDVNSFSSIESMYSTYIK